MSLDARSRQSGVRPAGVAFHGRLRARRSGVPFIDTGIGIFDDTAGLSGLIRITSSLPDNRGRIVAGVALRLAVGIWEDSCDDLCRVCGAPVGGGGGGPRPARGWIDSGRC